MWVVLHGRFVRPLRVPDGGALLYSTGRPDLAIVSTAVATALHAVTVAARKHVLRVALYPTVATTTATTTSILILILILILTLGSIATSGNMRVKIII